MRTWRVVATRIGLGLTVAFALAILALGALDLEEFRLDPLRFIVYAQLAVIPSVYAFLALRGRVALLSDAALASLLAAPTSFSGVSLVMVIPALLFLIARVPVRTRGSWPPAIPRVLVAGAAPVGVFSAMIFETTERCIRITFGTSCTDAAVTPAGALLALSAVAFAVLVGVRLSAPVESRPS